MKSSTITLTPARLFLILAWSFGPLFALITPPFQVPDEYDHFFRAYQVSEGKLTSVRRGSEIGGSLPASLLKFSREVSQGIPFHPDHKQNLKTLWEMRKLSLHPGEREFMNFGDVSWHAPMNYLSQAMGIAAARWIGFGPLGLLYAGRLANLIGWSLLIYAALRVTPICDWTILLLAMMPMSLSQAASLSADATVNGICFLFIAFVLRLALSNGGRISKRQLITLMILGAAVALAKTAYLPLTLLFLAIPAARLGGSRRRWLTFALFSLICLATIVGWSLCTFGVNTHIAQGISPRDQAAYILHHPIRVLGLEIGRLFKVTLLASIVGRLGWFDTRLFLPCVIVYVAVLIWLTITSRRPNIQITFGQRCLLALSAAGCSGAALTLIYLVFSRVGGSSIEAMQGRYLIPITPLLFVILYPGPGVARASPWKWVLGFSAGFSIYTIAVLVGRFYIS